MKNYEQILQELGIEIPEEKKSDLKKHMADNYRTINDYNNVVAKRDEYKESLETVQGKLDGFKDVDVAELKNQIATLTANLETEKQGRQADALKIERTAVIDEFLKDKEFVNPITEKAIRESIMSELEKGTGKSVDKIFDSLTKDKDGNAVPNILVDKEQQTLEQNRARFTQPMGNNGSVTNGTLTKKDIMAIKDPVERQAQIAQNIDLFRK